MSLHKKQGLIRKLTLSLLHVCQGFEESDEITNALLGHSANWRSNWKIAMDSVFMGPNAEFPSQTVLLCWVSGVQEMVKSGLVTPRHQGRECVFKISTLTNNLAMCIRNLLTIDGIPPIGTWNTMVELLSESYISALKDGLCGLRYKHVWHLYDEYVPVANFNNN